MEYERTLYNVSRGNFHFLATQLSEQILANIRETIGVFVTNNGYLINRPKLAKP